MNIHFRLLSKDEVAMVRTIHMEEAFALSEIKSLKKLYELLETGKYFCYGAFDDHEDLCAYAYFFSDDGQILLDYYAVLPHLRGKGVGSQVLPALCDKFDGTIWGEVEDPAFALNDDDKATRMRRIAFYENLGFVMTPLRVTLFGVQFCIITRSAPALTREILYNHLETLYRTFLSPKYFETEMKMQFVEDME